MFEADVVISHPSSVLIEALSLGTPVYLVDSKSNWDIVHLYKELKLTSLSFKEWLDLDNVLNLPFRISVEAFDRYAFNNAPDGENREIVYQFLMQIL